MEIAIYVKMKMGRSSIYYCNNIDIDGVKDKQKRQEKLHRSYFCIEGKKCILSLQSNPEYRFLQAKHVIWEREESGSKVLLRTSFQ